jgi:hypothetical protein
VSAVLLNPAHSNKGCRGKINIFPFFFCNEKIRLETTRAKSALDNNNNNKYKYNHNTEGRCFTLTLEARSLEDVRGVTAFLNVWVTQAKE